MGVKYANSDPKSDLSAQLRLSLWAFAGEIVSGALDRPADATTATAASMPARVRNSNDALIGDALRRDDIRWAQLELRNRGLYRGSLDGILDPGTRRAVSQSQATNDLDRTASLDAQTWEALTGNSAVGVGSSTPGRSDSSTTSDLGKEKGAYRSSKRRTVQPPARPEPDAWSST